MKHCFSAATAARACLLSNPIGCGLGGAVALLLLLPFPSLAHHPLGGRAPVTFAEGFMSGLAHPVIGPNHLAFVVAVGLLAAVSAWGIVIPMAFVLTAMMGTGLYLDGISLPLPELVMSGSVLGFGILLALRERPQLWVTAGLAALAGLFHGYAYGEAIVGAEAMPLVAYLSGFTMVQMGIAIAAYGIGRQLSQSSSSLFMNRAGLVICGIGATLLATALLNGFLPG